MKFLFHVGAGKTGSSAIQNAFAKNRALLQARGYFIPLEDFTSSGKNLGQHIWWFANLNKLDEREISASLTSAISAAVTSAKKNRCHTIIISAENLSNRLAWSQSLIEVLKEYETSACIYIRRQDDFLLSAWQQWGVKVGDELDEWLYRKVGLMGDWSVPIKQWQTITGNNLKVRVYQKNRLHNGNVVDDFFNLLGEDISGFNRPEAIVNSSFNTAVEELVLTAPDVFDGAHDNHFYNMLNKYCTSAHRKTSGESRLTGAQRRSIISRYEKSNNWIKSRYCPELEGPLFDIPKDSEYDVLTASEIEKRKWAVMTELVYGMHKHIR